METEQIPQTEEFLTAAIAWAKEVGKIHLAYFRGNRLDIHTKSNVADVVTRADRESEAYLLEKIAERFPTHSVLGEERACLYLPFPLVCSTGGIRLSVLFMLLISTSFIRRNGGRGLF